MLTTLLRRTLIVIGALALLVTLLPLLPSNENWIRMWDFPRSQIAVILLVVGLGFLPLITFRKPLPAVFLSALLGAFAYQVWRIAPYTPLHAVEAIRDETCSNQDRLSMLTANVRMSNRRIEPLLSMISQTKPDMVLLLETDSWWDGELAPLKADYPFAVSHPQDDSYGMHFFSKLRLVDPQIRFLIEDYVPSIETKVALRSGAVIDFHGVHPAPPPLRDTEQRDAELLIVARKVRNQAEPAVVAGDLNDVAWSRTTREFQQISGLLDPRIGRGLYPTYNANWPLLRWPLDHVFFESSFTLLQLEVMPDIGSDHFPFHIVLCHRPGAAARQAEPEPTREDLRDAWEAIQEGREKARETP